jgi:hypothetical protein
MATRTLVNWSEIFQHGKGNKNISVFSQYASVYVGCNDDIADNKVDQSMFVDVEAIEFRVLIYLTQEHLRSLWKAKVKTEVDPIIENETNRKISELKEEL